MITCTFLHVKNSIIQFTFLPNEFKFLNLAKFYVCFPDSLAKTCFLLLKNVNENNYFKRITFLICWMNQNIRSCVFAT